jgi:hypothetical protein
MAASRFSEEESGTYTGRPRRRHNGYYAGDFSNAPLTVPELRMVLPRTPLLTR